jgi:hypothetical protein
MADTGLAEADDGHEFSPEPAPNGEVWVKHRASGHVFKFTILSDNTIDESVYIVKANPTSDVDPAPLVPGAQRAAREYLRKRTVGPKDAEATDRPPLPLPHDIRSMQHKVLDGGPQPAVDQNFASDLPVPLSAEPKGEKARTKIGRAVLKNKGQIALFTEALLLLIDEKLTNLRGQLPNSHEATTARDEEIAEFEGLKQRLEAFRDATFAYLTGKAKEKPVAESIKSFADRISDWWSKRHVQICDKAYDMSLFLLGFGICSLAGAGGSLAVIVPGALVGGKSVSDAIKAYFQSLGPKPGKG